MKNKNKKFKIVLFAAAGALVNTVPVQADHLRGEVNTSEKSLEIQGDVVREPSGAEATYDHYGSRDGALCDLDAQADANLRLFQRGKHAAEMTERELHAMESSVVFPSDMDPQYRTGSASFMPNKAAEYQSGKAELRSEISEPSGAAVRTEIDRESSPSENELRASEIESEPAATIATPPAPSAPEVSTPQAEIKTEIESDTIRESSGAEVKSEVNGDLSTPTPSVETSVQTDTKSIDAEAQISSTAESSSQPSAADAAKAAEIQSGVINEAAGAQSKSAVTTDSAIEPGPAPKAGEIQSGQADKNSSIDADVSSDTALADRLTASWNSDPSLSASAQHIKVTTSNGKTVLRGTVKSEAEKQAIGAKAEAIVGADRLDNQIEVKSE